jgi:hypothetical protein
MAAIQLYADEPEINWWLFSFATETMLIKLAILSLSNSLPVLYIPIHTATVVL